MSRKQVFLSQWEYISNYNENDNDNEKQSHKTLIDQDPNIETA